MWLPPPRSSGYTPVSPSLKDLTFLILLIINLLYKLRHSFPTLLDRFEVAWLHFNSFQYELDTSFDYTGLLHFLQVEWQQARACSKRRTQALRLEIEHTEKLAQLISHEVEIGIGNCSITQIQAKIKPVVSSRSMKVAQVSLKVMVYLGYYIGIL